MFQSHSLELHWKVMQLTLVVIRSEFFYHKYYAHNCSFDMLLCDNFTAIWSRHFSNQTWNGWIWAKLFHGHEVFFGLRTGLRPNLRLKLRLLKSINPKSLEAVVTSKHFLLHSIFCWSGANLGGLKMAQDDGFKLFQWILSIILIIFHLIYKWRLSVKTSLIW